MPRPKPVKPFTCQYCKHGFSRESTLSTHVCEPKRRYLAKSEKHVVIAFDTFQRFFKFCQGGKEKTYDDFVKSPYYIAFVKFGSFVNNVNPLYPDNFINYVVTSGAKLDDWAKDSIYDKYVLNLVKTECVEVALERTIKHMITWGEESSADWNHYFKYVSLSRATFDIKDGKVSPWVILNCKAGKELLRRLDDTQLQAISSIMDLPYWLNKFKKQPGDVTLVKSVLTESNI